MLTLAGCPYCAVQIPDDGSYCDTCGKQLAACPTCNALAKPGEKCITHGAASVTRASAAPASSASTVTSGVAPIATPTVLPPPRRSSTGTPASPPATPPSPASSIPPAATQPPTATPLHAALGTSIQVLARRLRLVPTDGTPIPPMEIDHETIVGRADGPFAMMLDRFHDKGVSRRHCQFLRTPTGGWTIVDLAGRGSTWISSDGRWSQPIAQSGSHAVDPSLSQIRLGDLQFRVEPIP
jgi:FHA domain